jgi:phosphatidylglycerophosphate synthase
LRLVPIWMAPNLITTLAFVLALVGQVPLLAYGPDRPDWAVLLFAVCLFLYQTLDNIDGKQARRTGSSSALGMLFDHGLDTITAYSLTLGTANVLAAV